MEKLNIKDFKTPETDFNFSKIERECRLDLSESLKPPKILLSIGQHEYKGKYYPTPVMTEGELSVITAVSKAKKSFLKSAFIGAYIGNNAHSLFPNIKTHREQNYSILDFDTEQGRYYAQRTFRRALDISGINYSNYYCYPTRHLNSRDRLLLIDNCLKNQKELYGSTVKLVSIDGIADLVENTNDIVMSKEASDYVMKWTYDYDLHINTVIHKSPLTGKPLGHLGTYVLKKAESVIELDLHEDKDLTSIKVSNTYARGYKFSDFYFDVNSDALPYLLTNYESKDFSL